MPTCHDELGGVVDAAIVDAVARDARVVAEVALQHVGDPELGAVVEDADAAGDLDGLVRLVPQDLGGRGAAGLVWKMGQK